MIRWKILIIKYIREKNLSDFTRGITEGWDTCGAGEKQEVFKFLFNTGHWKLFCELFITELSAPNPALPWLHLLTMFKMEKITMNAAQKTALLKQLRKIRVTLKTIESYDTILKELLLKRRYNFLTHSQEKKQELLASVQIAQTEQLYDQQMNYLEELQRRFPDDSRIRLNFHRQQVSEAEKVLTRSRRQIRQYSEEVVQQIREEKPFIENLLKQCRQMVKKNPKLSVDIAFMFRQMGYSRAALEFIENQAEDDRISWLLFDFLMSAKQYVALLNHCEAMKLRHSDRPEALFSISYYEALTYWELGEKHKAIEFMRFISTMKPSFRFASELLFRWQEEGN